MSWSCFKLLSQFDTLDLPGPLVSEHCHDKCREATDRAYQTECGTIILTEWRSRLHCIIYQTPVDDDIARSSRVTELFEFYGEGQKWNEVLDNGFGKTYRREDMQRFALWSYHMDFQTFGTMAFHEVMW